MQCYSHQQPIKQTLELPVILNAITLLWPHCNELCKTYQKAKCVYSQWLQPVSPPADCWATVSMYRYAQQRRQGWFRSEGQWIYLYVLLNNASQITKFMGPTWSPPETCRSQMGPMLAPWTLLSGFVCQHTSYMHPGIQVSNETVM